MRLGTSNYFLHGRMNGRIEPTKRSPFSGTNVSFPAEMRVNLIRIVTAHYYF